MEITLSPEEQARAEQIVAGGKYDSVESLVRSAVETLLEPDLIHIKTGLTRGEMRRKIAEAQREREEWFNSVSIDEFFEEIKVPGYKRTDALQTANV